MALFRDENGNEFRAFGRIVRMFCAWIAPNAAQPEVVCECDWYLQQPGEELDILNGLPKITRWRNFDRSKFALLKNMFVEGCVFWPAHTVVNNTLVPISETFNVIRNRCDRSPFDDLQQK